MNRRGENNGIGSREPVQWVIGNMLIAGDYERRSGLRTPEEEARIREENRRLWFDVILPMSEEKYGRLKVTKRRWVPR